MKYKVTEYNSDFREEQTGTCEVCFRTALVENGSITVEDEKRSLWVYNKTHPHRTRRSRFWLGI